MNDTFINGKATTVKELIDYLSKYDEKSVVLLETTHLFFNLQKIVEHDLVVKLVAED